MTTATWTSARWWTSCSVFANRKFPSSRLSYPTRSTIFCCGAPGCAATRPVRTSSTGCSSRASRLQLGIRLEDSVGKVQSKLCQEEVGHNDKHGRNDHRLGRGAADTLRAATHG